MSAPPLSPVPPDADVVPPSVRPPQAATTITALPNATTADDRAALPIMNILLLQIDSLHAPLATREEDLIALS
jgi:hypothetical protein